MDPNFQSEKNSQHVEERDFGMKTRDEPSATTDSSPLDKKILLKLDCLIIPMLTMVYLLAFLDRANIGNARVVSNFMKNTFRSDD